MAVATSDKSYEEWQEFESYYYIKICVKLKCEIFPQWKTKVFPEKALGLLHFGSWQKCINSTSLVAEIN